MHPLKQSDEFYACIADLIGTPEVLAMDALPQHVQSISCLFHCVFVSYLSFRLCRLLHLDYEAAARGGLLHDLFLYMTGASAERMSDFMLSPILRRRCGMRPDCASSATGKRISLRSTCGR